MSARMDTAHTQDRTESRGRAAGATGAHSARRGGRWRRWWILSLGVVVLGPPARAESAIPVRLEGYWERSRETDRDVLGDLTLVPRNGAPTRLFGATRVQADSRSGDGIYLFTRTMRPAFTVTGPAAVVDRFFVAPRERKLTVTAIYRPEIGSLALTSVEIEGDAR
jgi:hypothetical protein